MKNNFSYFTILIISFLFIFPFSAEAANPALQFDGADDYVLLPTLNIGTIFSIECWFNNLGSMPRLATLFKNNYAGNNFGSVYLNYDAEINTLLLEWWWESNPLLYVSGLQNSTWYHFAFIADGVTVYLYLNGVKRASRDASPNYNNDLKIGESDEGEYFEGKVDEVRIYSRALSANEVQEHYQWTFSDESDLVGLWHFNEDSGEIAGDSSGQGNDGIIYGATWVDASEIAPPPPAAPPSPAPIVINTNPTVIFTKMPEEVVWRDKKTISYTAFDLDPFPRGLISRPINFYYSNDNGVSWRELVKEELNTGTYIFDTTKLPDGLNYKIKVVAVDGWEATGEAISKSFAIDNTGPNFTIVVSSTTPPPIKGGDKIILDITSSEDLKKVPEVKITQEGAEPQTVVVSGARRKFSASYTVLKGYPGKAVISIKGEDSIGNIGTKITAGETFLVGRFGPPLPVIETPANNQIFSEQKINVSGKAPLSIKVTLVLNGIEKFTTKPADDGSFVFKDVILSQANFGYNTLSLSGIDKKGIQSGEAIIKVKFNLPPRISLISKLEGTIFGQKKIEWLASDLNNDELSYMVEYSLDGGKSWDNLVSGLIENYYDFNASELFDSYNCRLKIIADDGAAKSEVISSEFAIKNNRSFSILNIPANYLIGTTAPTFDGQISFSENKIVSLKYSLDKEEWFDARAEDGRFDSLSEKFHIKFPSSLIDGKYILSIQAKDDKENFFKTFRMFIIDTLPPIPPTILSPGPDEIMGKNKDVDPDTPGIQINLSGKAEAGAELELLIGGVKYNTTVTSKGEFIFSKVTLLVRGLNRYVLSSIDAVGNISKAEGFIISNNPPEISILSPEEGEFIGEKKEIRWQASDKDEDPLTFQIFYRPKDREWISLAQNLTGDAFEWNTSKIAVGRYELKIVANDGLSETSALILKVFIDNELPQINFDTTGPIFTNDVKFLFSGKAKDNFSGIQYVEYTIDEISWYKALITQGWQTNTAAFEFYHKPRLLEGSYKVKVRATDGAGNAGYSEALDITVDTSPPLIGSTLISMGSLLLFPDEQGVVRLFKDKSYKILISASDDTTALSLSIGKASFSLSFNKAIALWEGEFNIKDVGDYALEITAKDQFGGSRTKKIADLKILTPGFVYAEKTNERIKGAKVSLFTFDQTTNSWLIWDGQAFGQKNPQETNEEGEYDFLIPPGKYRLEVEAEGFEKVRSEELEVKKNYLIDLKIPLLEKKGILERFLRGLL